MEHLRHSAEAIYRWLPFPSIIKVKLKSIVFSLIPSLIPLPIENPQPWDRKSQLLIRIPAITDLDGLEIGPLARPTVSKMESAGRIKYVDIYNAETLRELNKNNPDVPNINDIVETDFICGENKLSELVDEKQYDYVIASHIIEHVPDMLGWLKEIGEVLKDNGILSLAIPDKRYTFDYLRDLSTPGMLIEAYLVNRRRSGPREAFDFAYSARTVDVVSAWEGSIEETTLKPFTDLKDAFNIAKYCLENYKDLHVNVFTPSSFFDLIEVASRLELLDFSIVDFYDTPRYTAEFFISMERVPRYMIKQEILDLQLTGLERVRKSIA
jgi:predicted SAM-dependent methyltransferase